MKCPACKFKEALVLSICTYMTLKSECIPNFSPWALYSPPTILPQTCRDSDACRDWSQAYAHWSKVPSGNSDNEPDLGDLSSPVLSSPFV